ncbi:MAG: MFS transporter [Propionibacterium sp.]|nr:MFS transporter [Propionibacterium sp.]
MVLFLLLPRSEFATIESVGFWTVGVLVLIGAVVESARGIALSTTVTLLVPVDGRDKANGRVGLVNGLSFAVTSVFSGLSVGRLGMAWTFVIAVALTLVSLLHLWTVRIPEPEIVHADGVPKPVDFGAAWAAIIAVPGLVALIVFSTFNNLLGGVFTALMDPYGLTLVSVEAWGLIWGAVSFGFMIGGVWVARFGLGTRPLRALLLANVLMWMIGVFFTLRENIWLTGVGILLWMTIMPIAEAAEQTVLQRVVPYEKQGRVFGLAMAVELAASPISAFLVGPLAQFVLIPYLNSAEGKAAWTWLLGDGQARGIAAVFVLVGVIGLAATLLALASRPYRTLTAAYADAPAAS